ncbi:MAG: hypothetical protein AAFY76_04675 [Cyanobacteria bacterium J06649_11]
MTGEERAALQAYRREIAALKTEIADLETNINKEKEYFEGCNAERLEALNRAGLAEMEVKALKRENEELKAQIENSQKEEAVLRKAVDIAAHEIEQLKQQPQADPDTISISEVRSRLCQIKEAGKWKDGKVLGRLSGKCRGLLLDFLEELEQ